jgi:hypothetical protein
VQQADLFGASLHPVVEALQRLNPDDISAREALAILYDLQQKSRT